MIEDEDFDNWYQENRDKLLIAHSSYGGLRLAYQAGKAAAEHSVQRTATNCPPHVASPDGKYCIDCGMVL